MPVPAGVTHVVFGGALAGGEVWESGFWTSGDNPTTSATANALAELWWGQLDASDSSGGLYNMKATVFTSDISVTYVKVYVYNDGTGKATLTGIYSGTPYTGTPARTLPNQCSVVVSLRTGYAGRRARGRMYLPLGQLNAGSAGQLSSAVCTTIANAWATCFSDWNASGDNGQVVVVSAVGGTADLINQIQVDSRVDIQRRRANKQVVEYLESAAVTV